MSGIACSENKKAQQAVCHPCACRMQHESTQHGAHADATTSSNRRVRSIVLGQLNRTVGELLGRQQGGEADDVMGCYKGSSTTVDGASLT